MPNPYETSTNSEGSTLFERMRRVVEADRPEREPFDIPRFLNAASGERGRDYLLRDHAIRDRWLRPFHAHGQ